ncbi:hypothetical protein [Pannonibacter carbonis]|uniref:hypothetical protein n=1 Tax=Pannonibacter carbonis TaxID=2067569 RepID=UPI000D10E699|nr:hypothetical protein [Pannonibacter carbonis]
MLSDDITNLCRAMFIQATEIDQSDPMHQQLMRFAGRLQACREQVLHLERACVPEAARRQLVIDLSDDRIVPFPKFKRPVPDEGGAA